MRVRPPSVAMAACAVVALGLTSVASAGGSASFQPASVSFISASWGVALGAIGCQHGQTCQARLRVTTDGGATWHVMHAPQAVVSGPRVTISNVLFASTADGWLYGQAGSTLLYTNDGGAQWRRVSLGGPVDAMAAAARTANAVVSPSGHAAAELFTSPVGHSAWTRVGAVNVDPFTGLAVSGRSVWVTSATRLFTSSDGMHWHQYRVDCPRLGERFSVAGVAAATRSAVIILCLHQPATASQDKELLASDNGGKNTRLAGTPAPLGSGGLIAMVPGNPQILTLATSGTTTNYLYGSVTGGHEWRLMEIGTARLPWNSLSYVSASTGWVVLGGPGDAAGYAGLLKTTDAGRTWGVVTF